MEIRFSKAMAFPEDAVRTAARNAGVYARVKWGKMSEARFQIHRNSQSYEQAAPELQDNVN